MVVVVLVVLSSPLSIDDLLILVQKIQFVHVHKDHIIIRSYDGIKEIILLRCTKTRTKIHPHK